MLYRKIMETPDRRARNSKILVLINVLFGVVLFIVFLIFIRDIIAKVYKTKDAKPTRLSLVTTPKYERKNLADYEVILRNNPFGFHAGALKPLAGPLDKTLPASDMQLVGTISGNALYGFAVFIGKDGKQEIFKIGESVFGSGLLKRIEKNKVFIKEGDILTEIPMLDMIAMDQEVCPPGSGFPNYVKSFGKGDSIIDQKALQHALDNPDKIMTDARFIPNMLNNRQEGFILREIKKGGIYDSLGLRNDDILLRMNDYKISSPGDALQAFTALRGMERVRLDIIRSGIKMTMAYQIR
jgi:general secretion pathway protein C